MYAQVVMLREINKKKSEDQCIVFICICKYDKIIRINAHHLDPYERTDYAIVLFIRASFTYIYKRHMYYGMT